MSIATFLSIFPALQVFEDLDQGSAFPQHRQTELPSDLKNPIFRMRFLIAVVETITSQAGIRPFPSLLVIIFEQLPLQTLRQHRSDLILLTRRIYINYPIDGLNSTRRM